MKLMVSGHRIQKLKDDEVQWIQYALANVLSGCFNYYGYSYGLSGMASGVDLWFCQVCIMYNIPYAACIPFDEQQDTMKEEDSNLRETLIKSSAQVIKCRNSEMIEKCNGAVVVWNGGKGGTHNVFEQLLQTNKQIFWMIPARKQIVDIMRFKE